MQSSKARDKRLPFIPFGVVSLVLVLGNAEVAAQAITVAPPNPTISVGQPQQLTATGVGGATAAHVGAFHSCAMLQDGAVRCWGANESGQLGDGTVTTASTPVTVAGISGAVAISAAGWHTCALRQDGSVRCWGDNTWGELGNSAAINPNSPGDQQPVTPIPTPVTVSSITTAVAIQAGIYHMCATLRDGTLRCWGRGEEGRLGNGSTANSSTPVTISGLTPAVLAPGAEHTCAILQDRTKRCWGDNNYGQLGNGSPDGTVSTTPSTPVTGITTSTAPSSGAEHT